jgi:glycosyltransferase involved in cell wall biosynthesis
MEDTTRHDLQPRVTVVIPCFNQAQFLAASIASVRSQTIGPIGCLVIDDGSADDTARVAAGCGVRVVRQANRGVSAARNAGLRATTTEFVVFLDADDELLPGAVATGLAALGSDPGLAAVAGRCQEMSVDGVPLTATVHNRVDPGRLYEEWLRRNFVWTPGAAIFRTAALKRAGGFDETLESAADYALYLQLARTERVKYIPSDLVRYRRHALSMSSDPARMLRATLSVLDREARRASRQVAPLIEEGRRNLREYYGDKIVDALRADWHAGTIGARHLRPFLVLLRHSPRVAMQHAIRKASRVVSLKERRASR